MFHAINWVGEDVTPTTQDILDLIDVSGGKGVVIRDLSNTSYHGGPGVSNSGLSVLARSPAHYHAAYLDPHREPRKSSPAMEFGTAIHAAILEPHRFLGEYVRKPELHEYKGALVTVADYTARAKELGLTVKKGDLKDDIKEQIKEVCLDTVFFDDVERMVTFGKKVLTREQMDACCDISSQVRTHKTVASLMKGGEPELSIYWRDKETGVLCRCRPDYLSRNAILDVKSTMDASPEAFAKSIWNYRYWVQLAFYIDGVKAATGVTLPFVFLAWEKDAPNAAALYAGDKFMLAAGRAEYKRLLRKFRSCAAGDHWPGYSPRIETVSLPGFAVSEIERGQS